MSEVVALLAGAVPVEVIGAPTFGAPIALRSFGGEPFTVKHTLPESIYQLGEAGKERGHSGSIMSHQQPFQRELNNVHPVAASDDIFGELDHGN